MHPADARIKLRVRTAHAAAGAPSYAEVAARINAVDPEAGANTSRVEHWLAQGRGSVVIPARVIPALATVFGVTAAELLGVEDAAIDQLTERIGRIEATLAQVGIARQAASDASPSDAVRLVTRYLDGEPLSEDERRLFAALREAIVQHVASGSAVTAD